MYYIIIIVILIISKRYERQRELEVEEPWSVQGQNRSGGGNEDKVELRGKRKRIAMLL